MTEMANTDGLNVSEPAGVPEGTVLDVHADGVMVQEVVVHDLDDQGNVIGWHKEAAGE